MVDRTQHTWTVNSSAANALAFNATATITSNGKTFPGNVTFSASSTTKTLSGDWTITGSLTITNSQTVNSGTLNIGGGLIGAGTSVGTTTYNLNGTGTWSTNLSLGGNSLTFTSGTITVGNVSFGTGTMTYVGGTVNHGTSTLTLAGSCTLNTNGISWYNVNCGSFTITLNSLLTVTNIFTFSANSTATLAGTAGFNVATFTISNTSGGTITFKNGITYTIITAFNAFLTPTNTQLTLTSDDATLRANIFLVNDATICNVLAGFTRINATGRPINSFNGVITDCINVYAYTNVLFRPFTSFDRWSRRFGLTNKNRAVMYQ